MGEHNERGDLWDESCTTHEHLVLASPAMLIHMEVSMASIHQVKGYPVADCGSDCVRIVATMKVKLRAMRKRKTVIQLQIDLLRTNNEHSKKIQQLTSERIEDNEAAECLEGRYDPFRDALTESAQLVLPVVERASKQKWITAPILQKMDQRRLAKGNEALYNLLDREIRQE